MKHRKLKPELEPLGRTLLQGTWSDIARAAFRVDELRAEMSKLFLKEIWKECCGMVSKKDPPLLKKTSAEEMQELSLKKVSIDLKNRCPLLYSALMTAAIPATKKRTESNEEEKWLPSVVVAAAVVLKQRCQSMNAVQLMITTLIKYTGFHVSEISYFI